MGIENLSGKFRKPANGAARSAYDRLLYAERNGHPIEEAREELSRLGKLGAHAKKNRMEIEETDEQRRKRMELEALSMSQERNDHLLPEEDA